ncbi:MAG: DUF928 domain-containing protein [Calothrix sp. MO_192.B10]|nr:DUF928 domain-containing protein [Calothrix sp. MO_192.B10]
MHTKYIPFAIAFVLSTSLSPLLIKPGVAEIPGIKPISFTPPNRDRMAPGHSKGGASRGNCDIDKTKSITESITPLMPKSNIGLTQKSNPSVFVYLPQNSGKEATFVIKKQNGDVHYQADLTLPQQKPGVMKIDIPKGAELVKGTKYKWFMVFSCDQELTVDSPNVEGVIERVSSTSNIISQNKPKGLQSVKNLAQAGLWFDTVHALAELRQSQPKNVEFNKAWKALLEDKNVGLKELAEQPLIY